MTKSRVTNVQVPGETKPVDDSASQAQASATEMPTAAADAPQADIEALREQIRAEERAKLAAELDTQVRAAAQVVAKVAPSNAGRNYKDMRAHEVDATTLTAPVLTQDGWVCPAVPAKAANRE